MQGHGTGLKVDGQSHANGDEKVNAAAFPSS